MAPEEASDSNNDEETNTAMLQKLELLKIIPGYELELLAREYGIRRSGVSIEELRKMIAEVVPYEKIEEIYTRYEDAGNVTIHLFKFRKENVGNLSNEDSLLEMLKRYKMEDRFKKRVKIKLTSEPKIVFIDLVDGRIKIKLEAKGSLIIKRDADTRKIIKFSPLVSSVAFIHTDTGLVEIRVRERKYAKKVCEKLAEIFNNGEECEPISLSDDELEKIIEWAHTLRNATIKPLQGRISSLRVTAARDSDLREEKVLDKIGELVGDYTKSGVYVQYNHQFSNGRELRVGFQINSIQGKIFFKSYVSEEVITHVLSKIKEIKGL